MKGRYTINYEDHDFEEVDSIPAEGASSQEIKELNIFVGDEIFRVKLDGETITLLDEDRVSTGG